MRLFAVIHFVHRVEQRSDLISKIHIPQTFLIHIMQCHTWITYTLFFDNFNHLYTARVILFEEKKRKILRVQQTSKHMLTKKVVFTNNIFVAKKRRDDSKILTLHIFHGDVVLPNFVPVFKCQAQLLTRYFMFNFIAAGTRSQNRFFFYAVKNISV